MPLGPCSGFKAKRCNFYSFSFSFFFQRRIGLLSTGVLNILKAVNETRVGYVK